MEQIPGVTISVSLDGRPLEIQEDGYLGNFAAEQKSSNKATIAVAAPAGTRVIGFMVDNQKNVTPKRNLAPKLQPPQDGILYNLNVQIKVSLNGVLYADYPQNHMRFVELDTDGEVKMWEVALISQEGKFFLTVQNVYTTWMYRDENGEVVCPGHAKWPQMVAFLVALYKEQAMNLSTLVEYYEQLPPPQEVNDLPQGFGTVIWFNFAQGIGALQTRDGQARVHWSQVEPRGKRAYLLPCEIVQFDALRTPVSTKGRGTAFNKEAVGITLL